MTENIERLQQYISSNLISEDQAEFIVNILNNNYLLDYRKKMDFMLSKEDQNKIDSATPAGLNNELAKVLPRDQFPQLAYSYVDNHFGSYLNLDRLFLTKMYELFK